MGLLATKLGGYSPTFSFCRWHEREISIGGRELHRYLIFLRFTTRYYIYTQIKFKYFAAECPKERWLRLNESPSTAFCVVHFCIVEAEEQEVRKRWRRHVSKTTAEPFKWRRKNKNFHTVNSINWAGSGTVIYRQLSVSNFDYVWRINSNVYIIYTP